MRDGCAALGAFSCLFNPFHIPDVTQCLVSNNFSALSTSFLTPWPVRRTRSLQMKQGSLGFQFEHVKAWNFHRLLVFVLRVPLMFTSSYLGKSCAGSGLQKSGDCSVPVFWLKEIGANSPVCCYTYHMRTVSASYSLREFCILGVDLNLRRRSKDLRNSTNSDSVSGIMIAIIPAN